MVLTCRERLFNFPPVIFADGFQVKADQLGRSCQCTPKDRQHRRRRRAQVKSKHRAWKRRVLQHEEFLTTGRSSVELWNQHPVTDMEFFALPNTDSFPPHAEFGVVPEDVLTKFVEDRAGTFLAATRLETKLESADQSRVAEEVVQRASIFSSTCQTKCNDTGRRRHTHKTCPLVWDTRALAGLTPFHCDFIDYMECQIPVNDIARTNMVVGIGTTLPKFIVDGDPVYLPCLSYHLPTAETRPCRVCLITCQQLRQDCSLCRPTTYFMVDTALCLGTELLR